MTETVVPRPLPPAWPALRVLSSIRFDEVVLLQGAPVIGALFAIDALTSSSIFKSAVLFIGSLCLVAHVYALNDWAGIDVDLHDPNRATRTFFAKGASRAEVGLLSAVLLVLSLLLLGSLGWTTFVLALALVSLSALYSAPALHMKGQPVLGSVLHLFGGTSHFLLGYSVFASVDVRSTVIGCFFGLVFAAGHLSHETRGWEGDNLNGIRTNAVVFGKVQSFFASLILFTIADALLVVLALDGVVPRVLSFAGMLYPVQLYLSLRALRAQLGFESLQQLQRCYRLLYALVGLAMAAATLIAR